MTNTKPFNGRQNLMAPGWNARQRRWLQRQRFCQGWKIEGIERCLAPAVTVDHITPRFEGGTEDDNNLQSMCKDCHETKTAEEGHRAWAQKKAAISAQFDFTEKHPSEL